jgi:putative redox protein
MAVEITGTYAGNLKVALRHGPSGAEIGTAAPVDNNGDGSSFSPTDLVAAALGACMVTLMGITARKHGFPFEECSFVLEKQMRADPRRIDAIPVTLRMPAGLTAQQRRLLEHAALTCPVHVSLLPEIRRDVQFVYPDAVAGAAAPEAAATA